jgi:glycerophosphoryl diester phosphodiesterase
MVDPWVYANYVNADAIHPHYYVIAALPETVAHCHKHGVKVNVWTVDDPQAIRQMLECGVDGIISNRPDIARAEAANAGK